jgi:Uma2 family endonuclease
MQAVVPEVPEALLAERKRLGHDRFDEMWEGVLHMVPPPNLGHQGLESWLVVTWAPLARAAGLRVTAETGVFDRAAPGFSSYRQPDVVVWHPSHASARGIEGRAELVVEIRSPADESYQKLAFYDRVGVQELLVIELDMSLRHWARQEGELIEVTEAGGTQVTPAALPVTLRKVNGTVLAMEGSFGTTTFDTSAP